MNSQSISNTNSAATLDTSAKIKQVDLAKDQSVKVAVPDLTVLRDKQVQSGITLEDAESLKKAEVAINEALLSRLNQKLSFSVDENTGRTVIKILDKQTEEVVKQFPPQEFLDMVYSLNKAASVILKDLPKYI
ncbi:flagellar protein FlaG [bacterium]|nr:MAG: flagellar protein FlaG [bacterium]